MELFNGRNRALSSPQQSSLEIVHLMFSTESKLQTSSLFPLCNISTFQGMSPYKCTIKKKKRDRKSYYAHLLDLQKLTVLILWFSFLRLIQNSVFTVASVGGRMQKT